MKLKRILTLSSFVLLPFLLSPLLIAQGDNTNPEETKKTGTRKNKEQEDKWKALLEKAQINVIGDKEDDLKKIPGSANLIDKKLLEETNPVDSMEAIRRVPGATIRYQDAVGLTPNIAFRGVSNEESRKTLILEDGIFTSLSPYGQPESYFVPQIDRMERVEIVKGSGSILFGPTTLGGIVNYVTRKPPIKPSVKVKTVGGNNGYLSNFIQAGGTIQSSGTAYDVSFLHTQGNGYRNFQGFNVNDANLKIVQEVGKKDVLLFKYQKYQQDAQSTYLGLTEALYWKNPKINPARYDRKHLDRDSAVIGHDHTFNKDWKMITRAYWTNTSFQFKQENFTYNTLNQYGAPSPPPANTFATYSAYPIGNRPGDVIYMLNETPKRNQFFRTGGLETKVEGKFSTFGLKHELTAGARAHYESVYAAYDKYARPYLNQGLTFGQQDRAARAYATYVQDSIHLTKRLKIIPGVRYENIFQGVYTKRKEATAQDIQFGLASSVGQIILTNQAKETYTKVVLPGFGITYDITEKFMWFAGAHTAFSPPTFSTLINPSLGLGYKLNAERSNNYETGVRGNLTRYFYTQISTYALYFSNQIVNTNEVGSSTGSVPINAGRSVNRGLESSFVFDWGKFFESKWEVPLEVTYSYTHAISTTYVPIPYTQNPDGTITIQNRPQIYQDTYRNIIKVDTNRNYLPYVAMNTAIVAFGFKSPGGYFARVEYQYIGKEYSDLQNTKNESPDGNLGVIPAYGLWNLDLGYEPKGEKWSIFLNVKNLQDRVYISGRLPAGIQQGPYRQINLGVTYKFD